ncbi:hypothetical protein [Kineosporia babensis]|uniref:Uncharacterized protein n=1 Tax=Kineosporia babensis TaxID=499548 RepID=A0A9X1NAF6_9ACTN|nr:hypothetical protein [Kineosporia babensis]MCD5310274.1 hypothetical protein [Kineosporia babensis]
MSAVEIFTLSTEAGTQHTVRVKRHLIGYSVLWERDGAEVLDSWDAEEVGIFGDEKSGVLRVQVPSASDPVQEVALYPLAGSELKALKEQVYKGEPGGGLQFGASEFVLDGDDSKDEKLMDENPRAYAAKRAGKAFFGWSGSMLAGLVMTGLFPKERLMALLPDLPGLPVPDVSVDVSSPVSLPDLPSLPFSLPDLPSLPVWVAPVATLLTAAVLAGCELYRVRHKLARRQAALHRIQAQAPTQPLAV